MLLVSGAVMACRCLRLRVLDAGGQAIADAWSELRMDLEDAEALGKAASAAKGAGLVVEGKLRVRFSWLVKRAPARQGAVLGDGAAQDLAKLFQEAGAYAPAVDPTPDLEHEWGQFLRLRVLAARMHRVIRTMSELRHDQLLRGRAAGLKH